jgi:hypothetical protein
LRLWPVALPTIRAIDIIAFDKFLILMRESTTMKPIPNRPAISNVLIKASANITFRAKLLTSPHDALAELNVPPEDAEILANIQALTLPDYARQVKMRLLTHQL